jgi:hypothetical protein
MLIFELLRVDDQNNEKINVAPAKWLVRTCNDRQIPPRENFE